MPMRNGALLLVALVACLFAQAQTVTISEEVVVKSDGMYALLGELQGNVLVLAEKSNHYEVYCFDRAMGPRWTRALELDKRRPRIIEVFANPSWFAVLYQHRAEGTTRLKMHKYSPGALLIDSLTVYDLGNTLVSPFYETAFSQDKQTVLVYWFDQLTRFYAFAVRLTDMKVLWQTEMALDDILPGRDFRQALISNDGRMFAVFDLKNRKPFLSEHHLRIFTMSEGQEQPALLRVPLPDMLNYDLLFDYDHVNDKLVAGGLYSDGNVSRAEGIFMLTIDPEQPDQILLARDPFDESFISQLLEKPKNKKEFVTDIKVRDLVLRRDGGLLVLAEQYKEFRRYSSNSIVADYASGYRNITDYYFDNLVVQSFHPDGQRHWRTVLYKKQYSQDDFGVYSSYFLMKTPLALRLIFNDEIKYGTTVSEYVLQPDGSFDRNSVMSTEGLDLKIRFRDAMQTAANALIAPSERRNRIRLVRIEW